jgi:predicted patatin/cPLA2 family phospholipase
VRLILEGGGVRAAYSSGVVHALSEAGIRASAVVGSSSGSVNAAFYAAGQTQAVCDIWRETVPGRRFINYRRFVWRMFIPFGRPGLDVDEMMDNVVAKRLDMQAATTGSTRLYVVATMVSDGSPILVRPNADNLLEWLRASNAIPAGYNRIVRIEGKDYVDGGVVAPVAFHLELDEPCEDPTVVVLTRRMETNKGPPNWWQQLALQLMVPKPIRTLSVGQHVLHNQLMQALRQSVDAGEIILVDPPPEMPLSRLTRDRGRIETGIQMGLEVGRDLARRLGANKAQSSG